MPSLPARLGSPGSLKALCLSLFLGGYFYTGGGASQQAHYATMRALLTQRTFALDAYPFITVDVARLNGHTYSNKPPGFPVLMLPAAAVGWAAESVWPGRAGTAVQVGAYVTQVVGLGGAGLWLMWSLVRMFRALGSGGRAPWLAALGYLGTYLWTYSTTFFSHLMTAALAACAVADLVEARAHQRSLTAARSAWVGVVLGAAVTVEYSAAVGLFGVGIFGWWWCAQTAKARGAMVLGVALPAGLLLGWQWAVMGSPFSFSYAHVASAEQVQGHGGGFLGAGWPRLPEFLHLTAGWYRGLFSWNPLLVLCALGLVRMRREKDWAAWSTTVGLATTAMLLFISGYWAWEGGSSFGPRFLVPLIPLLLTGLVFAEREWPRATTAMGLAGGVMMVAGPAACMIPHASHTPGYYWLVPYLAERIAQGRVPAYAEQLLGEGLMPPDQRPTLGMAWNLGHVMGLHGAWTLVPFFVLVGALATALYRSTHPRAA